MRTVGIKKEDIKSRAKRTSAKLNPVKKSTKPKSDAGEQKKEDSEESE